MMKKMRITILACCVMLLAVPGFAKTKMRKESPSPSRSSKANLFAGYSYWAPSATVNGYRYKAVNEGFTLSAAYYFTRYIGAQFEATRSQQTSNDGMRSFSGGLIVRDPHVVGMVPFMHGLIGVAGVTGPNEPSTNNGSSYFYNPERWGAMLTVGGGLDYRTPFLRGHLHIRLFQADYQYTHVSFGPLLPTQGGRVNIDAVHLSTGIVYCFNRVHF